MPGTLHSYTQAIAALVFVLGLIFMVAWLVKKFALGHGATVRIGSKKPDRRLKLVETLLLDGRYRLVAIDDHGVRRTLLLGPQEALQLGKSKELRPDDKTLQPGESPTGLLNVSSEKPAAPSLHAER